MHTYVVSVSGYSMHISATQLALLASFHHSKPPLLLPWRAQAVERPPTHRPRTPRTCPRTCGAACDGASDHNMIPSMSMFRAGMASNLRAVEHLAAVFVLVVAATRSSPGTEHRNCATQLAQGVSPKGCDAVEERDIALSSFAWCVPSSSH